MPTARPRAHSLRASFRFRGSPPKDSPAVLYLEIRQGTSRPRVSTRQRVRPDAWDPVRQRAMPTRHQPDAPRVNGELRRILDAVEAARYDLGRAGESETPGAVLATVRKTLWPEPDADKGAASHTDPGELQRFWRRHAEEHPGLTEGTRQTYRVSFKQITRHYPALRWADITLDWYGELVAKLRADGLRDSTIGRAVAKLKAVLRAAQERGIDVPQDYRRRAFRVFPAAPDTLALAAADLEQLHAAEDGRIDCGLTDRERRALTWFLLGCRTGLRFGDLVALSPAHFPGDGLIHVKAAKTREECRVPVHPFVAERLPPDDPAAWPAPYTNQELNRELKGAARKAGLTRAVTLEGAEARPLHEVLTSHTARRTFATELHRQGATLSQIMAATGHKTEASLRRYLRMGRDEVARTLAGNTFFS